MTDVSVPPDAIRTERLLLRCWEADDAPAFKRALDASLPELRPWIPWSRAEPSELDALTTRLAGYHADFHAGRDALYGIFHRDGPEKGGVLGGVGFYRRVGPGALEIGYWIRSDLAGRGYATEATGALTTAGMALPGVVRLEIRCDPRNAASAAVPKKLGYRLDRTLETADPDGSTRATMVWVRDADPSRTELSPPSSAVAPVLGLGHDRDEIAGG